MSLIKHVRREFLNKNGMANVYISYYFLGILVYKSIYRSESVVMINQFNGKIGDEFVYTQNGTLYRKTDIGFKFNTEKNYE